MNEYGYWGLASCYDWYETNEKMWFCLSDKNAICEMNKYNGKIRILGRYPNQPLNKKRLSMSVAENKGYLVFSPFSADDIAVYNIKNQEIKFYPVQIKKNGKKVTYSEDEKFFRIIAFEDYIFLVGRTTPTIVRFSAKSGKLEYFDEWSNVIDDTLLEGCINAYFSDGYALVNGYLYIGLSCTNAILKINHKTMEWEFERIECGLSGIGGLLQTDDAIWLSGFKYGEDILVKIELKSKRIDKIKIPYPGIYLSPFCFRNEIYLTTIMEQRLYRYSIDSAVWSEVKDIGNGKIIADREHRIIAWKTDTDGFTLITGNDKNWIRFGHDGRCTKVYTIEIDDAEFLEECSKDLIGESIIPEGEFSLNAFIQYVEVFENFSEKEKTSKRWSKIFSSL